MIKFFLIYCSLSIIHSYNINEWNELDSVETYKMLSISHLNLSINTKQDNIYHLLPGIYVINQTVFVTESNMCKIAKMPIIANKNSQYIVCIGPINHTTCTGSIGLIHFKNPVRVCASINKSNIKYLPYYIFSIIGIFIIFAILGFIIHWIFK